MDQERYEGEGRGLGCFLEDIAQGVEEQLGRQSILYHALRRALSRRDLKSLRHARDLFNALPRPQRQLLSLSGVVRSVETGDAPEQSAMGDLPPAATVICFRTSGDALYNHRNPPIEVETADGEEPGMRVLIKADTLPKEAACRLREIADMIETDRKLLSTRYWRGTSTGSKSSDDTGFLA
ncbi:MAG: hypothetical protein H6851_15660 [Geminicoccaceae bacterium]|nr:hypothetical protein [Geminicoccaceae bacterium]MCB9945042.1 hypothetical protein [Geminicoccaceae bacterium]